MLARISKKIGLTRTELRIVVFVFVVFSIGFVYRTFFYNQSESAYLNFDYSEEDAKFLISGTDSIDNNNVKSDNKKVDYKQEVLDFNTRSFDKVKKKTLPAEKSININSAKFDDLINLPGIGEKTAQNIIDYRKKNNRFRNINELQKVKGIGKKKLNKIKKYIFIE